MKKLNNLLCGFLCLIVLLAAFAMPAAAANGIDPDTECELTLYYVDGETPLDETEFKFYRIADINEDGEFTLVAPFNAYPIDFTQVRDQAAWATLALTLSSFVERDALPATITDKTNDNAAIALRHMKTGLYLVLGGVCETNGKIYTAIPTLVSLPSQNEAGEYYYDVVIFPKHESIDKPNEPIDLKVLKAWDDNNNANRPKEIEVDLLCDGEVYDTVKLNRQNAWTHTWTKLEANHDWNVAEHAVEGYKVKVVKDGRTFQIINSGDFPHDNPPENPQTGLLWWPVPVLIGAGLLFAALGTVRRKRA